ncbi:response regulator [Mesobacillus boroniphilus]|uniref:Response regulator n=1 Tax=Mesobacillus boroniphilus TaxID=308892 RepID=A0A944GY12_9BACI|nr:response regulator [Mesobacillus boroniphilus]MBS8266229.1 response regulator [Mesobacillus boroniphilus]
MIKLLIVDDEQIERDGMQVILQRAYPDIIVEQAKNGKIAVELAGEFKPDLILMDIMMPGMNGLEAIEKISADYPEVKFVMVTAYDMFDYARTALKLGVKDYLLKPSKPREIVETVGKVLEEIEAERASLAVNKLQQEALEKALRVVETDVVTQLLYDHVHEVHIDLLMEMLDIKSTRESFVMVVMLPAGSEHLYQVIKEKVRKNGSGWVGALSGCQLPIIVFRQPDKSYRTQAVFLARDILSSATADTGARWFIGIGDAYGSLDQIRQSYQEALNATMDLSIPVKYRFYSDMPILGAVSDGQLGRQREKQLFDQVRLGQWDLVVDTIMEVIHSYANAGTNLLQAQQRILELLWMASRVMSELGIEIDTPTYSLQAQDYRQLRIETNHLLEQMRQVHEESYDRLEADKIQQIKQYITEHSNEDISLDALANKVGLSPIYISKMFKEKLGVNYIDFLTECRIEKAKKLLADSEKSLKEITFEIGYHEPNYFSKVFKKMCSISPTEYRKTLLSKK